MLQCACVCVCFCCWLPFASTHTHTVPHLHTTHVQLLPQDIDGFIGELEGNPARNSCHSVPAECLPCLVPLLEVHPSAQPVHDRSSQPHTAVTNTLKQQQPHLMPHELPHHDPTSPYTRCASSGIHPSSVVHSSASGSRRSGPYNAWVQPSYSPSNSEFEWHACMGFHVLLCVTCCGSSCCVCGVCVPCSQLCKTNNEQRTPSKHANLSPPCTGVDSKSSPNVLGGPRVTVPSHTPSPTPHTSAVHQTIRGRSASGSMGGYSRSASFTLNHHGTSGNLDRCARVWLGVFCRCIRALPA